MLRPSYCIAARALLLSCLLPFPLFAQAVGDDTEYRFELMLPQLEQSGYLYRPQGLAIAPDDSIWVAETYSNRILHILTDGSIIAQFDDKGSGAGQFDSPIGLDIAPDGSVWVADSFNNRIQHLTADGRFITQLGRAGHGAGQFINPNDLALAPDGSVWIVDTNHHRIQHLKADGGFITQFGSNGFSAGQFNYPRALALASDGSVWVADTTNNRVQHFKADGTFIAQFGGLGYKAGQFQRPYGIAAASDGSVWVADTLNDRIQHIKANGDFIAQFGRYGSLSGQFNKPSGLAIAPDGSLWVADTENHRLQKFTLSSKYTTTTAAITHPYKAVILAGGGRSLGKQTNSIWDGTWRVAQKAFRALSLQGFKVHDEIKFLTAGTTQIDLDANNHFDDLVVATKDSLRNAITDWAKDAADVVLYLADHGGPGKFQVNSTEILQGNELNAWISDLQQHIPGKVTIIIDSCNSAGFFNYLAQPKRYLLASARADQAAVIANDGLNSFSYTFWSEVATGAKVQYAFMDARQAMSKTLIDGQGIDAQMDDDGDGQFNQQDLTALGDYCFGNCNIVTAGAAPNIQRIIPEQHTLINTNSLNLSIKVDHLQPLEQAWALVQRPDDQTADTSIPLNFEKIPLDCNAQDLCTGKYAQFDVQGDYRLQFYAMDSNKFVSFPEILTVNQPQGKLVDFGVNQPLAPPAEENASYDATSQTLSIQDVQFSNQHYQVKLQLQANKLWLVKSAQGLPKQQHNQPIQYDGQALFLPRVQVFGVYYNAVFSNKGNNLFGLDRLEEVK